MKYALSNQDAKITGYFFQNHGLHGKQERLWALGQYEHVAVNTIHLADFSKSTPSGRGLVGFSSSISVQNWRLLTNNSQLVVDTT